MSVCVIPNHQIIMSKCTTCQQVASTACSGCNVPFCNIPCQRVHHYYYDGICGGVKRDRSPDKEDEDAVDLIYLQAIAVVRKSGACNMITEPDCVFVSLLCVLNVWNRSMEASAIVGKVGEIMKILTAWRDITREQRESIDASIEGMPYSGEYIDAVTHRWNREKMSPALIKFLEANDYNEGGNWAKFLVNYSKEQCMFRGIYLRDKVKIDSLKGIFDPNQLMIAGAQFPARDDNL